MSGEGLRRDGRTADRGESLEDQQRDRASNGLAGGYDDSIATRKDADDDRAGVARGD